VAHSAGGLVLRRYAQLEPERARRRVHQAVFLGTPFRGTFAPAQLFSGQHDIVRRFGVVLPGVAERLVRAAWTFVGMAELLPDPDLFDCAFLYRAATWPLRSLDAARLEHARRFGDALRAPTPWLMERTSIIRADDRETTDRATFDGGVLSFFAGELAGDGTIPSQSSWDDEARAHYRCRAEHSTLPLDGDVRAAVVALLQSDGERAADLPKQTAPARPKPTRALAAGPEGIHHDEAGAKQRVEQGEPRAADVVWLLGGDPKPLR
jgi:pimeloyl-ACP methyl ester carboxylesterase